MEFITHVWYTTKNRFGRSKNRNVAALARPPQLGRPLESSAKAALCYLYRDMVGTNTVENRGC